MDVLRLQETLRTHLRHRFHATAHFLARIADKNSISSFGRTIRTINASVPTQAPQAMPLDFPPWTLSPLRIKQFIPGIDSKKRMPQNGLLQITLAHINRFYSSTTHIFTDGSATSESSSSGIFIPSANKALSHRLERATSSTLAELHAIKEAIRYILRQPPTQWTIFSDSKAALQSLKRASCFSIHEHIQREVKYLHHLAYVAGHRVTLQWLPGHCGVWGNQRADEAARRGLDMRNGRRIFFTRNDASSMTKALALTERNRLWSLPEHHQCFLRYIDPHLRMRLPERLPRRLETLYHRLRLDAAFTNSYLHRIGQTSNPYCDNCGSPETVEHLILECPAYTDARCRLEQKIKCLNPGPITLRIILGPWHSPSSQRKALEALFDYLQDIGVDTKL